MFFVFWTIRVVADHTAEIIILAPLCIIVCIYTLVAGIIATKRQYRQTLKDVIFSSIHRISFFHSLLKFFFLIAGNLFFRNCRHTGGQNNTTYGCSGLYSHGFFFLLQGVSQKQAPKNGFYENLHIKRQTRLSSRGKTLYPLSIFSPKRNCEENHALSQIIFKLYSHPVCLLSFIFQGFFSLISQNKNDLGMRMDSHFKVVNLFFILFLGLPRFAFGG